MQRVGVQRYSKSCSLNWDTGAEAAMLLPQGVSTYLLAFLAPAESWLFMSRYNWLQQHDVDNLRKSYVHPM